MSTLSTATVSPSAQRLSLRECDDWRDLSIARHHRSYGSQNAQSRSTPMVEIERIRQRGLEVTHLYVG
jgi:hypothetical protein